MDTTNLDTSTIDPDAVDPAQFAAVISGQSDAELAAILAQPAARALLLDSIFERMPLRIKPERAKGMREVVHWKVGGKADGGHDTYQVLIDDGTAVVTKELDQPARVTFIVDPVAFLRMIAGQTTGMKLVLSRKMQIKGDMMFAPRMEQLFKVDPAAA